MPSEDEHHSVRSISIPFHRDDEYNLTVFGALDGSDQLAFFNNELPRGKQDKMLIFDFLWADETVEHLAGLCHG